MPSMANLTVKKADGTTNQVWTAVQPSGGDKSPAIWRNQSVGVAPAFMPEMRMTSRPNSDGTVRRIEGTIDWKQSAFGGDGIQRKVNTAYFKFELVLPQSLPYAETSEFAAQATGLVDQTLIRDCIITGFAPQ